MSHFSVLVIGQNPEQQLEPYNESLELAFDDRTEEMQKLYATGGVEYVRYKDGRKVQIYSSAARHLWQAPRKGAKHKLVLPAGAKLIKELFKDTYADFETFAKEYYGLEKNTQGRYGYMHNPNAKWDWYELGGRWKNNLPLKRGGHANDALWCEVDVAKLEIPFAVLKHGKWHEKGKMGWWAMVSNEKADDVWDKEVKQLVADIDPDTPVYIYDCHI